MVRFGYRHCINTQKPEKKKERYKGNGEKSRTSRTPRSWRQQAITGDGDGVRTADSRKVDSRKADIRKADSRTSDSRKADIRDADSRTSESRTANIRKVGKKIKRAIQEIHPWNIAKAAGITLATAWLYYRSFWMVLPLFPLLIWHLRMMEEECDRKKEMEFQMQFKEAIQAVSSALNTGYSVENAFREAQKELRLIYPENARISKEMLLITRQLRIQMPMEQILEEFGARTQAEDVRNFVTVFAAAKKSGGNMIAIIQDTVRQIGDKIDVKREIETILAAKRYEFRVMSAIPYAIIGYMSLSFPEFMGILYGNVLGIGVMTICLGIYMGAYYLGVRLVRIEV